MNKNQVYAEADTLKREKMRKIKDSRRKIKD